MDEPRNEDVIKIDMADPRWKELLELDEKVFKSKQLRLLTPEARILFHLMVSGPLRVTDAMQGAATSYRGFYAVLERLKKAGLVSMTRDRQDQRARNLTVGQAGIASRPDAA
jgi:DNA-binding MarR family transcriptional regulator